MISNGFYDFPVCNAVILNGSAESFSLLPTLTNIENNDDKTPSNSRAFELWTGVLISTLWSSI
jgi:hypothetical protein